MRPPNHFQYQVEFVVAGATDRVMEATQIFSKTPARRSGEEEGFRDYANGKVIVWEVEE